MTAVGMKIKDQTESYSGYRIEDTDRIWTGWTKNRERRRGLGWLWVLDGGPAVLMLGVGREVDELRLGPGEPEMVAGGCGHQLATMHQGLWCVRYLSDSLTSPSQ